MVKTLQPIHPGEILSEEFLQPLGITASRLASDIDVPGSRISEIVNGNRAMTADTALRLGIYFDMDAQFWLNLQMEYELRLARAALGPELKARIRKRLAAPA